MLNGNNDDDDDKSQNECEKSMRYLKIYAWNIIIAIFNINKVCSRCQVGVNTLEASLHLTLTIT